VGGLVGLEGPLQPVLERVGHDVHGHAPEQDGGVVAERGAEAPHEGGLDGEEERDDRHREEQRDADATVHERGQLAAGRVAPDGLAAEGVKPGEEADADRHAAHVEDAERDGKPGVEVGAEAVADEGERDGLLQEEDEEVPRDGVRVLGQEPQHRWPRPQEALGVVARVRRERQQHCHPRLKDARVVRRCSTG
jgi:hypothetical protein